MGLADTFYEASKTTRILFSITLLILISLIDRLTGSALGLSIFYLIPILLANWTSGKWVGVGFSVVSAAAWLIADLAKQRMNLHLPILYWNMGVRLGFFIVVVLLFSALRRERELSRLDALTGVANRQAFVDLAEQEIARSRRYGHPVSVAFLDCDGFKAVNDTYGHLAGDRLLVLIARALRENLRSVDLVARLGGDEFAILMPQLPADVAKATLNRLRGLVAEVERPGPSAVTLSIGAVTFSHPPESVAEMLRRADDLMYRAKVSGKDQIVHEVLPATEGAES